MSITGNDSSYTRQVSRGQSSVNARRRRHRNDSSDEEEIDLTILQEGCMFLKFGRKGPVHERLIRLTDDCRYIEWNSSWIKFKPKEECRVDLEAVSRIQHGQMTANFERHRAVFGGASGNSFSLIYGDNRSLDLIAPSPEVFRVWFLGLKQVLQAIREERVNTSAYKRFLKAKWDTADSDGSGTLTKREVVELVASMNVNRPKNVIYAMYTQVDVDNSGTLTFEEFCDFIDLLRRRPEIEFLWCTIAIQHNYNTPLRIPANSEDISSEYSEAISLDSVISVEEFIAFWRENQKQHITYEKALEMIAAGMGDDFNESNPCLTLAGFNNIMCASFNDAFDISKQIIYQDMTYPLSYYFMASSHNTYLEGDQLKSASSVNRYINDLCKGCRCVELDCWDGDDGEPVIYHGHTLTAKVLFEDVIKAMAEYNFRVSPYPVVLSIENHCSLPQQEVMARIIKREFGSNLLMPGDMLGDYLPSLEQLKYKVLIKGKRVSAAAAAAAAADSIALDDDDDDDDDDEDDDEAKTSSLSAKTKEDVKTIKNNKKKHKEKTHPDLSAITYLGTCHVKSFSPEDSAAIPPDMMTSYSEIKTLKYLKKPDIVKGWIEHNKVHLSRIYPKGTRVDSSNLDPCPAWSAGNQLVALNYQTPCVQMHLNDGKFRENGECGYVLRPQFQLTKDRPKATIRLVVHVISAQQLPKPGGAKKGEVIDPYVSVNLYGPSKDPISYRTKVIQDNGFNPIWNEVFSFEVKRRELCHLYFRVMDSDLDADDFIAYSSTPVDALVEGYRTFKLFDEKGLCDGDFAFAGLFCRITIEDQ